MKRLFYQFAFNIFLVQILFAQFGQNKVHYKNPDWFFIQTKHFDIYYAQGGERIAEFTASAAEDALTSIQKDVNYQINNRITIIAYNSHNDFQETNITDEYFGRGTGGFTEPFKNRVVFPFEGSYKKFQHVIAHELVHAVMRDMYYGGTIQNIITKGITLQLPTWFWEGSAEFLSQGWETNTDMFIRNSITSESLPDIMELDGYLAYRGGQSLFKYVADTYGRQKIGEIMNKAQGAGSLEAGLKSSIGIGLEELNERWKKNLKKEYWPDIALYQDPDEFSKRLTDNKKVGGFYNTSPAISPQGDKIAFISDRDVYLDVYIMNSQDGKILKKIVESGKTTDFEELTVLNPSISWAPDNKRIALSSKSGGYDIIRIVDTETEESYELPFKLIGIESISWSHDGNKLAFVGQNSVQSDIYIYDIKARQLSNITNDVFSDSDPVWTPDGNTIVFSSDRCDELNQNVSADNFVMYKHHYRQLNLYMIDVNTKMTTRITDWPFSDEKYPIVSSDGKEILFVSDKNGINNIYKMKLPDNKNESAKNTDKYKAIPITNSLSDLGQLSTSYDGKKLVFTALYKLGYNIFILTNPFDLSVGSDTLKNTSYMTEVINQKNSKFEKVSVKSELQTNVGKTPFKVSPDSTGKKQVGIFVGSYISDEKEKSDSTVADYSKYIFGGSKIESDSTRIIKRDQLFSQKLDKDGNYLVNRYKVNFSPDIIYANAGYSTLYGLLGTTVLAYSDVLGNHRLIGQTSLQVDIKNSDYGLAYYYLKDRINYGLEAFHTARFLYRDGTSGSELYRFTNTAFVGSISFPIDRFYRYDFGFSLMSVSSEDLDNLSVPTDQNTFTVPSVSFVHDNVLWGYTSPIEGTRYYLTLFGDPGIIKSSQSFFSAVVDYRKYFRFWYDNCFVFRLSGGYSGGGNAQRFFIGGTDNWINRSFASNSIPVASASDFAFLTPALPLRGYNYAQQIGTKYGLMNLELRIPIIRYLLTGGLPLFFQNILGTAFIDAGSAWDNTRKLQFVGQNDNGNTTTKDLLLGTGVGFRLYLLFLWRVDIAWRYNLNSFSAPVYYLSLGLDF